MRNSDELGFEIQYANGHEQTLRTCAKRETALRQVDALYLQGYPLHYAYVVRPGWSSQDTLTSDLKLVEKLSKLPPISSDF